MQEEQPKPVISSQACGETSEQQQQRGRPRTKDSFCSAPQQQQQQSSALTDGTATGPPLGTTLNGRRRPNVARKAPKQLQQEATMKRQQMDDQAHQQQPHARPAGTRVLRGYRLSHCGLEGPSQRLDSGTGGQSSHLFSTDRGSSVGGDSGFSTPHCVVPGWCNGSPQTLTLEEALPAEDLQWLVASPVQDMSAGVTPYATGPIAHPSFGPPHFACKKHPFPEAPEQSFASFGASGPDTGSVVLHPQVTVPLPPVAQRRMPACACQQQRSRDLLQQHQHQQPFQQSTCIRQYPRTYHAPPSGVYVHPLARTVTLAPPASVGWGSVLVPPSICLVNGTAERAPHCGMSPGDTQWPDCMGAVPYGGGAERIFTWMQQVTLIGKPTL